MDERRYRDAALGAFIGFAGILVLCIVLVIGNYFNPNSIEQQPEIDTLNKNIDTIEGCVHSIYEDEYVMWITANGDTIWE